MPTAPATDADFVFRAVPALAQTVNQPFAEMPGPLGPLAALAGTWQGKGFNTIWRPHNPDAPQDRFLELNVTSESLAFTPIAGAIPNRGLLQPDINMFGLTYMQQIADVRGPGLHVEPGIWAVVPQTEDPNVPPSVVRMASIPHGTVILAQGKAIEAQGGPKIETTNIIPFPVGGAEPPDSEFPQAEQRFTELDLSKPSQFRDESPGVDQDMVINPNKVLTDAIAGQDIKQTTVLIINTTNASPLLGGGTANTAFLQDGNTPAEGGNANASRMTAIFWIETVADPYGGPDYLQLQYTQKVMLDFKGLSWPHVTVATLRKTVPVHVPLPDPAIHPDGPTS